jgi:hypothetical protein
MLCRTEKEVNYVCCKGSDKWKYLPSGYPASVSHTAGQTYPLSHCFPRSPGEQINWLEQHWPVVPARSFIVTPQRSFSQGHPSHSALFTLIHPLCPFTLRSLSLSLFLAIISHVIQYISGLGHYVGGIFINLHFSPFLQFAKWLNRKTETYGSSGKEGACYDPLRLCDTFIVVLLCMSFIMSDVYEKRHAPWNCTVKLYPHSDADITIYRCSVGAPHIHTPYCYAIVIVISCGSLIKINGWRNELHTSTHTMGLYFHARDA